MRKRKFLLLSLVLTVAMGLSLSGVSFGEYPEKPIKMIVPWGTGSTSLTARVFNNFFTKYSPQPLVVVLKPGSAGVIGTRELMRSRPDGYTLLWESIAVVAVQPHLRDTGYTVHDFEYILGTNEQPLVLFVSANSPYENLEDFVKDAKRKPGKISVAVSGIGTLLHLAIEDLALREDLDLNIVPIPGAEIISQVVGGHIDVGIHHPSRVHSFQEAGQVKVLCTFASERLWCMPDIPTAVEQGYDVRQSVWQFILAPKGTPEDRVKWIHDTFKKTLEDKGFQETAKKLFITLHYRSGEECYQGVVEASERYKEIVKELGLVK